MGEDFTGESSVKLRGLIKLLSKAFYDEFHKKKIEVHLFQIFLTSKGTSNEIKSGGMDEVSSSIKIWQ